MVYMYLSLTDYLLMNAVMEKADREAKYCQESLGFYDIIG